MGDTAWLLFQKCSPEEARIYLKNRKEKRFSVIQATLVHCLSGDGILADDPSLPSYWENCDKIIDIARELGLYMGLLPCWGSFVRDGSLTVEKALQYADFLASRYSDKPNIIWILGSDVRGSEGMEVFRASGRRMRELFPPSPDRVSSLRPHLLFPMVPRRTLAGFQYVPVRSPQI